MEKIYQASTAEGAIDFINMRDLEIAAEEVIPKGGYGYISSGAGIFLPIKKMNAPSITN